MKKFILLLIIPFLSFSQPPIPPNPDDKLSLSDVNEVVEFAVVETSPIFPGCEKLEIDGKIKEINADIKTLNSIY